MIRNVSVVDAHKYARHRGLIELLNIVRLAYVQFGWFLIPMAIGMLKFLAYFHREYILLVDKLSQVQIIEKK